MTDSPDKIMLVGQSGSGRMSLIQALTGIPFKSRKAMAVEYFGRLVKTPGEFLENRRFYHALITTAADCSVVAMLQDSTQISSLFPPQFAGIFNRRVIGLVTKVDIETGNIKRSEAFLKNAGACEIIHISSRNGKGLDSFREIAHL